jgi:hypothetical protein
MSQRSQITDTSGNLACVSSGGPLPSGRASSSFTWFWCPTKKGNLLGLVRKRIKKRWMCQFEAEKEEKREKGRLFAWSLGTFSESYDQGIYGWLSFYLNIFLRSHCWKMLGSVCSRCWSPINPLEMRAMASPNSNGSSVPFFKSQPLRHHRRFLDKISEDRDSGSDSVLDHRSYMIMIRKDCAVN